MQNRGFTIVELIVIIVAVGVLAGIATVSYGSWQRHTAAAVVKSDVTSAIASLKTYRNSENSFPPNLAGTGFTASPDTALALYTDAPTVGVYENLVDDQNAQLLLNVCNAVIFELSSTNTSCVFQGSGGGAKIHAKGTEGSNAIWPSPIDEADIVLDCGPECDAVVAEIKAQFTTQGGTFPVIVSGQTASLPPPTLIPNGTATRYCIEGRSGAHNDVTYHALSEKTTLVTGACPEDPELHYLP